jgi:hypothetical protein
MILVDTRGPYPLDLFYREITRYHGSDDQASQTTRLSRAAVRRTSYSVHVLHRRRRPKHRRSVRIHVHILHRWQRTNHHHTPTRLEVRRGSSSNLSTHLKISSISLPSILTSTSNTMLASSTGSTCRVLTSEEVHLISLVRTVLCILFISHQQGNCT